MDKVSVTMIPYNCGNSQNLGISDSAEPPTALFQRLERPPTGSLSEIKKKPSKHGLHRAEEPELELPGTIAPRWVGFSVAVHFLLTLEGLSLLEVVGGTRYPCSPPGE